MKVAETKGFRIYHVTRYVARHNYELDDKLYGSPLQKETVDWPLEDPSLYLQRLNGELSLVESSLDDLVFLMREKGWYDYEVPARPDISLEEADAYAYHKFHTRQFEYAEKLRYELQSLSPIDIDVNIPKAKRQFNILLAARCDILATIVRFTDYAQKKLLR